MNCASVKAWMRERFDQGLALESGFESHLTECPDCRAYHDRLVQLETAMSQLAGEAPSPGFVETLPAHVRRSPEPDLLRRLASAVAVLIAASVGIGWSLPIELSFDRWLDKILAWFPQTVSFEGVVSLATRPMEHFWSGLNVFWSQAPIGAGWLTGGSITVLALMLLAFNVVIRRMGDAGFSSFTKRAK